MAVDPVPLAIGNGAVHSDDVMRVGNNIYTQNASGVNLPGHFKVTATSPASGNVVVAPGGITLASATESGHSYIGRNISDTTITSGTGITAAGYHLVIARVIDPQYAPWQPSGTPGQPNTSVANGPYFQVVPITGVGSSVRRASQVVSYTAEAVALIENPSGSGTITQAMIRDLGVRRLARPRFWPESDVQQQTATDFVTGAETAWHDWPANSLQVDIPVWATDAVCSIRYGVKVQGPLDVDARVALGNLTPGPLYPIDYNSSPPPPNTPANVEVLYHEVLAKFDVTTIQGQTVSLRPQARRNPTYATVNTGSIWSEATQQVSFRVDFKEQLR
jgi:hypothetical protein